MRHSRSPVWYLPLLLLPQCDLWADPKPCKGDSCSADGRVHYYCYEREDSNETRSENCFCVDKGCYQLTGDDFNAMLGHYEKAGACVANCESFATCATAAAVDACKAECAARDSGTPCTILPALTQCYAYNALDPAMHNCEYSPHVIQLCDYLRLRCNNDCGGDLCSPWTPPPGGKKP